MRLFKFLIIVLTFIAKPLSEESWRPQPHNNSCLDPDIEHLYLEHLKGTYELLVPQLFEEKPHDSGSCHPEIATEIEQAKAIIEKINSLAEKLIKNKNNAVELNKIIKILLQIAETTKYQKIAIHAAVKCAKACAMLYKNLKPKEQIDNAKRILGIIKKTWEASQKERATNAIDVISSEPDPSYYIKGYAVYLLTQMRFSKNPILAEIADEFIATSGIPGINREKNLEQDVLVHYNMSTRMKTIRCSGKFAVTHFSPEEVKSGHEIRCSDFDPTNGSGCEHAPAKAARMPTDVHPEEKFSARI